MFNVFQLISKLFWLISFVLLSVFVAIFVGSNVQPITLSFWPIPGQITIVVWLAIISAFSAGLVIGALIIWLNSILYIRATKQKLRRNQINSDNKGKSENERYLIFDQTNVRQHSDNKKTKHSLSTYTTGP